MSIEHVSKFITDLAMHFSPPRFDKEHERQAWQKSIMMELHGASPEVLERAARLIIQSRKNRYFPLIAECRQAVRDAADEVRFDKNMQTLPEFRQSEMNDWSTERCRLAHELKRSPLGKQAAREGWIVSLWHFVRRHQRVPAGREIDQCKQDSEGVEEAYARCMRGEAGPCSEALANLGASILEKRQKWSEEALGQ